MSLNSEKEVVSGVLLTRIGLFTTQWNGAKVLSAILFQISTQNLDI